MSNRSFRGAQALQARRERLVRALAKTGEAAVRVASSQGGAYGGGLGIVLAGYDAPRTRKVIDECVVPLTRKFQCSRAVLVANSSQTWGLRNYAARFGIESIPGTNSVFEFSAYQEGAHYLKSTGLTCPVWVIANDRALSYEDSYLASMQSAALDIIAQCPIMSGRIDTYFKEIPLKAYRLQTWCRSNFFVLSELARQRVLDFVTVTEEDLEAWIPKNYPGPRWIGGPHLEEYSRIVTQWLTSPEGWYRAASFQCAELADDEAQGPRNSKRTLAQYTRAARSLCLSWSPTAPIMGSVFVGRIASLPSRWGLCSISTNGCRRNAFYIVPALDECRRVRRSGREPHRCSASLGPSRESSHNAV